MENISRRAFVLGTGAAGAAGIVGHEAAANTSSARDLANYHWLQFCAAMEDLVPEGYTRMLIVGNCSPDRSDPRFEVTVMREEIEGIGSGLKMKVERKVKEISSRDA